MRDISGIVAWLCDGALSVSTPEELLTSLCDQLIAVGIPLERAAIYVRILHPEIAGRGAIWRRGQPIEINDTSYQLVRSEWFLESTAILVQTDMIRHLRLDVPAVSKRPRLLDQLRGEGFTDYLATPLRFSNGEFQIASWTTRQPSGFDDEDVAARTAVSLPLARIVEIRSLRRAEETLLATYIGTQAAGRVLAGNIRRGDLESIHAVIWLSDLRGFTSLADRMPPSDLIKLLNRYFDCQVPAIEARQGEVEVHGGWPARHLPDRQW